MNSSDKLGVAGEASLPGDRLGETLKSTKQTVIIEGATVRLAGDSGDGMQLAGTQLTGASTRLGNDVATFPDFPAEIRAPKGTTAGVSGFQVRFSSKQIFTPGDTLNALVAMNPAALKTNLHDLAGGGILIVNEDEFDEKSLQLSGYTANPLEDESLNEYQLIQVPMTRITREAVAEQGLSSAQADRCRNFFAMGLVYWLYGRSLEPTLNFIETKFGNKPQIAEANRRALNAGWYYGETTDAFGSSFRVDPAKLRPGKYRSLNGNKAMALGLLAAAKKCDKDLFLGTYPITPASDILHELSHHKNFGVRTFQAEDEIAAMCSTIGAAFGGLMAVTTSSGPGIALKGEALGLALMLELPMLIVNVQRGGPSTGLPTKTEQADLLQAVFGRNGEAPIPVLAARSPSDCFHVAMEAWRIAVNFMTPVIVLTDGYIANGTEPWRIPTSDELPSLKITHPEKVEGQPFYPYARNDKLARPWAIPGTEGLTHRLGGLEKQDLTGNVSYDGDNHEHMVQTRARKIANIALDIPLQEVIGPATGKLLVLSWGGTYGSCATAVDHVLQSGGSVAHAHLRYLNPLPSNLEELLNRYDQVLIPELNLGQLQTVVQAAHCKRAIPMHQVKGKPFSVQQIVQRIEEILAAEAAATC
ncbi:2-oxoacid:acceptor oxidoreductase subunit alpha [Blastopirellula marina]|uniref:2-oxoglutarate ferredoxin oxidoreductase subunit alpha n=1 Tax=Blastopirellula marina TaxID=124 RepID=A0A2S8GNK8_9BACT|nr:2-oxoacid:acceptor oxidoreductase subunit alpha [Blastopirellula marina]PQO46009.1 2-oxoglutarate ferredoxin oxidoreductase subunit alpha [Blastopirellula marina]